MSTEIDVTPEATASLIADSAKFGTEAVSLFVADAELADRAYIKAKTLWQAKESGVTAVFIIGAIQTELDRIHAEALALIKAGQPVPPELTRVGTAPSAGKLSQYRGAWQMVLDAGISPDGRYALVGDAFTAKAGRFSAADIKAKVAKVAALPEAERADALAEALAEPSTKGQAAKRKVAEPPTLAEVLAKARGALGEVATDALTDALAEAEELAKAISAELAARAEAEAEAESLAAEALADAAKVAAEAEADRATADTE